MAGGTKGERRVNELLNRVGNPQEDIPTVDIPRLAQAIAGLDRSRDLPAITGTPLPKPQKTAKPTRRERAKEPTSEEVANLKRRRLTLRLLLLSGS